MTDRRSSRHAGCVVGFGDFVFIFHIRLMILIFLYSWNCVVYDPPEKHSYRQSCRFLWTFCSCLYIRNTVQSTLTSWAALNTKCCKNIALTYHLIGHTKKYSEICSTEVLLQTCWLHSFAITAFAFQKFSLQNNLSDKAVETICPRLCFTGWFCL